MARPRRSTKQELYDQFADFDIADQAVVLEFLIEQHRQNKRTVAKRNGTQPEPELESQPSLLDAAVDIAGALKSALNVKRPERTPGAATILGEPND